LKTQDRSQTLPTVLRVNRRFSDDTFLGEDAGQNAAYERELINIEIAKRLYDLRTKAGLSQRELARKVGATASAICGLEDADYEGHSLSMLLRIAAALDQRIEIRFVPIEKPAANRARRTTTQPKRKSVRERFPPKSVTIRRKRSRAQPAHPSRTA
jgi:transcriptional regulator with XRE-family HTH domain